MPVYTSRYFIKSGNHGGSTAGSPDIELDTRDSKSDSDFVNAVVVVAVSGSVSNSNNDHVDLWVNYEGGMYSFSESIDLVAEQVNAVSFVVPLKKDLGKVKFSAAINGADQMTEEGGSRSVLRVQIQ